MKLNIAYPLTGCQKLIEVDDERKLRAFYDKRISHEVDGGVLGDDFKGYVFRITGGNDLQGFPMKQGVLTTSRVRLLLEKNMSCYRPRRKGERKRKSIRGCIVSSQISVLNLVIVKRGQQDIDGLTNQTQARRLGPKRASKIRRLFNLGKDDDVRAFVIRRSITKEKDGKQITFTKAPKIQRLITPQRLQRKRAEAAEKRRRYERSEALAREYNELMAKRAHERSQAKIARRRSQSRRQSEKA